MSYEILTYIVGAYAIWLTFMIARMFAKAGANDIYKFNRRNQKSEMTNFKANKQWLVETLYTRTR